MRPRSILVTVLFFILFFSFCRSSFGDGYYVPEQYVKLPNIPVQRALIKYRDGVETLIVESTLDGPGQKFGWIIPVPSVPQRFEKVTPGVLKTLSFALQPRLTHHRPRSRGGASLRFHFLILFSAWAIIMFWKAISILCEGSSDVDSIIAFNLKLTLVTFVVAPILIMIVLPFFAVYGSSGPPPPPTTVRVESQHAVGNYEISVVTAQKSSDLNNWLEDNGFRSFPDKAIPAVDDYIGKNWAFIAAKIVRKGQGTATPHPILIELKTDRPVYPMRLTALSESAVNLELFVLAEQEAVPVGYDLKKKYCDYFDYKSSYSLYRFRHENISLYAARAKSNHRSIANTIGHPLAMKLMWSGCVLTKLAGEVSSKQMKEDMFFSLKQAVPYRYHVYSSQWVIERGAIVAIAACLFGLHGLCFLYTNRESVSPLLLPGLLILSLGIFSAIYFSFEKVDASSQFTDGDWGSYEMEIHAFIADYQEGISELSDEEISKYLSERQTYTKNILTNQNVIVEDSPGNISLERNGLKRSLVLHLPNGTAKTLMEFVARIDHVDQLGSLLDVLKEDERGHLRHRVEKQLEVLDYSRAIDFLATKLKDEDPRIRRNAVWLLGQSNSFSALKPLLVALKDQDKQVRAEAVAGLGKMRQPQAVKLLLIALKDQDEGVRAAAATSLGEFQDPQVVEPLIEALKDDSGQVDLIALQGLAKINNPRAVEALISALQLKSLRLHAVNILGNKRELRAVEPLIALLADDDKHVRESAAKALGQIRDPRAVEALINLLEDKDGRVRAHAVRALDHIGDFRAVEPLTSVLLNDNSQYIRADAAIALGNMRNRRAVEPLITTLKDQDSQVRANAASALGKMRDPRAVEPLFTTLQDPHYQARANAAAALGKIGDERAVKHLKDASLNDPIPWVRRKAASALQKIERRKRKKATKSQRLAERRQRKKAADARRRIKKRKRTASPMRQVKREKAYFDSQIAKLKNEDYQVRNSAVWALIRSHDPQALDALIALQQDEDPSVRVIVAWALSKKNDLRGLGTLLAALKDENPEIRRLAAGSLKKIHDPLVLEALFAALQDESPPVRVRAAIALGDIGNPRAVHPLIAALDDSDFGVRMWSARALERMRPQLVAALEDKDLNIRSKAANALVKIKHEDYGVDSAKWQEWYEKNKETLAPWLLF